MRDRELEVQLFQSPRTLEDLTDQVCVLRGLVLRLVQEVEVLRDRSGHSAPDGDSDYVRAWEERLVGDAWGGGVFPARSYHRYLSADPEFLGKHLRLPEAEVRRILGRMDEVSTYT